MVFSGLDVVFTVYAVERLQLPASDLALLRSLRLIVSIPFILVMGGVADLWGTKKTAFAAILMTAATSVLTIAIPSKGTLFATFPVYGGLTAILLVSMNVISQSVKDNLRNLSNTLYRSTFIGFAIAGPLCAGLLISYGYLAAFLGFAVILAASLGVLSLYPEEKNAVPPNGEWPGKSVSRLIGSWNALLHDKPLMTYMLLNGLLNHVVMVNLVLIPIKLMNELGVSSRAFTYVMTLSSVTGLLFTVAAGFLMKKHLAKLVVVPMLLSAACNLVLGLQANAALTIVLFMLASAFYTVTMAPTSLWLSGMAKRQFGAVFSFFKIVSAGLGVLVSAVLSMVQPALGIDKALVAYGTFGVLASLLFMRHVYKWQAASGGQPPARAEG